MIKIEKTDVYGFESAIRGMRNPLNSWDKSDSYWHSDNFGLGEECEYIVEKNDLELMKKLAAAGNDHGKFMRMITVTCDIVAPLYWWKEFDTYKVGTVANSCSTMHKIADKTFHFEDFSYEHLFADDEPGMIITVESNETKEVIQHKLTSRSLLMLQIELLNLYRNAYLETKDKQYWWQMIQLLPCSYNQRRTVQLNYAVLKNMYYARKNHKLDEWHDFCHWIEELPYSELITGEKENECK